MEYSIVDYCLLNGNGIEELKSDRCFMQRIKLYHPDAFTKSRARTYVDKRRAIFYILNFNYGLTLTRISHIFNMNHATVLHSIKSHRYLLQADKNYRTIFNDIKNLMQ